jgi:hypothetical protein
MRLVRLRLDRNNVGKVSGVRDHNHRAELRFRATRALNLGLSLLYQQ